MEDRAQTLEMPDGTYHVHLRRVERSMVRRTARSPGRMFPRVQHHTTYLGRRRATTASRMVMAARKTAPIRTARSTATPQFPTRRVRRCTGRKRTTPITLRAERTQQSAPSHQSALPRRAIRTAMAAHIAVRLRRPELIGQCRGLLGVTPITRRRPTPVLRHTLPDVRESAPTAAAAGTPPVRIMAPAGTLIRAELTRLAATDQPPRIRLAVMARWGRTLRLITRAEEAEAITRLVAEAAILAAAVVDIPAVDTANFWKAMTQRSGLQTAATFFAL
jgi:hypothetical protein